MSRKMNKMLRDAGYADVLGHNILWFCNTGMQKAPTEECMNSAAGAALFVQIIPHGALVILLFDLQNHRTVFLLLL